jgi:hypothetical protein
MSLLNLLSYSAMNLDLMTNLIKDPEFASLVTNMQHKKFSPKFVTNLLYKQLDPIVCPFIKNKNNAKIFSNDKLSIDNKCKVYLAMLVAYIHKKHRVDIIKTFGLQINGNIKLLCKNISILLFDCIDAKTVKTGVDIYKQLVIKLSIIISNYITEVLELLTKDHIPFSFSSFKFMLHELIEETNKVYNYVSMINEINSDSDSDNENSIEDNKKDLINNGKRKRNHTDEYGSKQNKKPKIK